MSDTTTIARPYAKAVFEHALDQNNLGLWSQILHTLAQAIQDTVALRFLTSPSCTEAQQISLLRALVEGYISGEEAQAVNNLLKILAENKRVLLLPDILLQYEILRHEQEKTLTVEVRSYKPIDNARQDKLIQSLNQRLQRVITLDIHIDESLLGGIIIRAGDLVIDGSVRGQLNKLSTDLAA